MDRHADPGVPDYSGFAAEYAASRPEYPPELFEWLARTVTNHDVAWDAATGNGQAAIGLAAHFAKVIASDLSESQIRNARQHDRVEYRVGPVEQTGLAPHSIDLVAAAAAIHWFDRPRFYEEVRRVIRAGGTLAAWTYHVAHVDPPLDTILWPFYRDVVSPYFGSGARMVDERYEGLALPGEALEPPSLRVSARWNAHQVLNFVRTWSGVQACMVRTGRDPVLEIEGAVRKALGGADSPMTLTWPLYIRASRLGTGAALSPASG